MKIFSKLCCFFTCLFYGAHCFADDIQIIPGSLNVNNGSASITIQILDGTGNPRTDGAFVSLLGDIFPEGSSLVRNADGTATITTTENIINQLAESSSDGRVSMPIAFDPDGDGNVTIINEGGKEVIDPAVVSCSLPVNVGTIAKTIAEQKEANADRGSQANTALLNGDTNTTNDSNDPVSTATREFFFYQQLFNLRGPTLPMEFSLYHGSQLRDVNYFDHLPEDFIHNHHLSARIIDLDGTGTFFNLEFHIGLGRFITFERTPPATDWTLVDGERWKFSAHETSTHIYLCDPEQQLLYTFKKFPVGTQIEPAFITRIEDRHGNALSYNQPADPTLTGPTSVTDNLGRSLTFTYGQPSELLADFRQFLTQVTDHEGRTINFSYTDLNALPRLDSITDSNGGVYQFVYDANGFMTGKTMPAGNTPYTQTFETIPDFLNQGVLGAVTTQTDAFGNVFNFKQGDAVPVLGEKQVIVTNPDGSQAKHFHSEANITTAIIDELGRKQLFTPNNQRDQITTAIDRDGGNLKYTYRDAGHIVSITNQIGDATTYTYADVAHTFTNPDNSEAVDCTFSDVQRIDYADGTSIQFLRNSSGNPTSLTNRAEETTTFTYNGKGQPLSITNPTAGITTLSYDNATGLPATATDSDTGTTSFTYDGLSRLITRTNPDSSTRSFTYDDLDRLTSSTNEENVINRFGYDPNSNLIQIINAETTGIEQMITFTYDALDRLSSIQDANSETITYAYDYHEKPISTEYPDGTTSTLKYDKRRSLIQMTDEVGNVTRITRTPSDLIASITSALQRTTSFVYDPRGEVTQISDPTDDITQLQRDVFGRITSSTDPLQRKTTRNFDGEGRKLNQDDPLLGTSTLTRDNAGRLTKLTDPLGNEWDSTYTAMGRLLSFEDPNNRSQTRTYDNRGRLETLTQPDGIVETRVYNPDSTLQSRSFSDGLNHSFSYDELNRITSAIRTLGSQSDAISLIYDKRNDVTSTTVNGQTTTATYDSRRRLKTITYPSAITVTYTYDSRGLVTRIGDSLTNSFLDFTYNADREVTSINRSNGASTAYTYDGEGLLQSLSHNNGASINWTHNKADEPTAIADTGFPIAALPNFTNSTQNLSFNASSQITTAGHSSDSRGRRTTDPDHGNYTWDSDNRLISVTKPGATISYCYDVLGNITSRTSGADTTKYLYNFAIATRPIIGEQENGDLVRLYIPFPDGRLAYFIDNPTTTPVAHFYHFGKTGNTRFLSDSTGAVTDAYAYDPYGQLLNRSGTSDQIFTYVGAFGVRQDEEVGLSHMRNRYYDFVSRRFLSRDPIFRSLYTSRSAETNPYHYTRNLPTSAIDPDGLKVLDEHGGGVAGDSSITNDFQVEVGGTVVGEASEGNSSTITRIISNEEESVFISDDSGLSDLVGKQLDAIKAPINDRIEHDGDYSSNNLSLINIVILVIMGDQISPERQIQMIQEGLNPLGVPFTIEGVFETAINKDGSDFAGNFDTPVSGASIE